MVRDEDEIPGRPERMHAAGDVGDDQRLRAQRAQHAHRKRDLLQRVALIAMKAALHHRHRRTTERAEQQAARMRLHGRPGEAGNLGVRDRDVGLQLVGQRPESGPENDRDVRNDCGPRLHGADRVCDGNSAQAFLLPPSSAHSSAS